jgi:hypothetical protein
MEVLEYAARTVVRTQESIADWIKRFEALAAERVEPTQPRVLAVYPKRRAKAS